jgi:hypothetical protein
MKQTLIGPAGLTIVLDSDEIIPDDPGAGTPAMVHLYTASSTYWWAIGEGTLDAGGRDIELSTTQKNWLDAQENAVEEFLERNDPL